MALSQAALFDLVTQLTGRDNKIIVDVAFVHFCGDDLPAAVFLSQLIYWTPRAKLAGGWIAKSKEEWYEETCLSPYFIRKATEQFERRGFLKTTRRHFKGAPTVHFLMNREIFMDAFVKFLTKGDVDNIAEPECKNFDEPCNVKILTMDSQNFDEPNTDTTSDTTSDSTKGGPAKKAGHGAAKSPLSKSPNALAPHTRGAANVGTSKEPKEVPVYSQCVTYFYEAHKVLMGGPVIKFGAMEGKHIKEVVKLLRAADGVQSWEEAAVLFAAICSQWGKLDKWYQGKFSTSILLSKLNEIVGHLRLRAQYGTSDELTAADLAGR